MSKVVTWCGGLALLGVLFGCGPSAPALTAAFSWGRVIEVPGLGALSTSGNPEVSSVSCGSAGNCAAGGYYWDLSDHQQGFIVAQRDGRWGTAIPVPGLTALNKGRHAQVNSVSCTSAGNCVAGGFYYDRSRHRQGFVTTEDNGTWDTPIPLPGLTALNKGGSAQVTSLSCPSPGTCTAAGFYADRSGRYHGFVTQAR